MALILKKTTEPESYTKIMKIKMNPLLHHGLLWCSYALYVVCLVLMPSCNTNTKQRSNNTSTQTDYYRTSPNISTSDYQTSYKYNVRYGTGGYNYDVAGQDENGDYVYGNIDVNGKYGTGYIENEYGDEVEIDVEWTGYGELEGTDEDGNIYYLEVD